jgi:hypothetical protein
LDRDEWRRLLMEARALEDSRKVVAPKMMMIYSLPLARDLFIDL